ncbi:xanthine dehydrogenase family protein molybdopterin-binding subunit [Promicromonospora sp. MS192]|uniref:xanthine dehydrogenase family protein molybdopterin-binding subunit n=1 Tax=Promicromonospora sp. MS192 TaxID=3412684 RepID=UPI003C2E1C00
MTNDPMPEATDDTAPEALDRSQEWASPRRGGPALTRRKVLGLAGMAGTSALVVAASGPPGSASPSMRLGAGRGREGGQGWIGKPLPRVDGPLKVRGAAPYAAEFTYEGMVYAALVFSTIAKGRIAELDTGATEAAPGVVFVLSHLNAPRMGPMVAFGDHEKAAGNDRRPTMQDDRVRWNGQPVAVVLADTQEEADHAASLVRVVYEAEPATTSFAQAVANGTETAVLGDWPVHVEIGDAEAALSAAQASVDAIYRSPHQNHNAIEPHAVTAVWDGDELEMYDSTQSVVHNAWTLAQMFGIEEEQVHVVSPFVGGSFGGKFMGLPEVLAAAAARAVGRPVRMALSREAVYRLVGGRALTEQRVAIGADRNGRIDALIHTGTSTHTPHNPHPEAFVFPTLTSYATRTLKIDLQWAYLDMVSNHSMRAPGEAVGSFALESAIDELAHELKIDPIELRIRNEPAVDPLDGRPFSSRNIVQAWHAGAERFGWARRNPTPRAVRHGDWLVGMGCGTATHHYSREPTGRARFTLTREATLAVDVAAHDAGMGTATAVTLVVAELLALRPDRVEVRIGDSTMPGVIAGNGSQQIATVTGTVVAGKAAVVAELLRLVRPGSPLAGLTSEQVTPHEAGLSATEDRARYESYASILGHAGLSEVTVDASGGEPVELARYSMASYGAMFAEVRVNAVTGEPRVTRLLGSMDCGRVMNARTAASQFRGGMVMAMGLALNEATHYDERNGRIMNPSLSEYHIPVHLDVPEIDVIWTGVPDPHTPMGGRGIGELGVNGTGAAIANAIFNATGTRVHDLPITLDKLM